MISVFPANINVEEIEPKDIPTDAISQVGHGDFAQMLSGILGREIALNRVSTKITHGDELYVAQYCGGRLAEGCITLPADAHIRYLKVTLK